MHRRSLPLLLLLAALAGGASLWLAGDGPAPLAPGLEGGREEPRLPPPLHVVGPGGGVPGTPVAPREIAAPPQDLPNPDHAHLLEGDVQLLDHAGAPVNQVYLGLFDAEGELLYRGNVSAMVDDGIVDTELTAGEMEQVAWWWVQPRSLAVPHYGRYGGEVIRLRKRVPIRLEVNGTASPWPVEVVVRRLPDEGVPEPLAFRVRSESSQWVGRGERLGWPAAPEGARLSIATGVNHMLVSRSGPVQALESVADGELLRVSVVPVPGRWFRLQVLDGVERPVAEAAERFGRVGGAQARSLLGGVEGFRWWDAAVEVVDRGGGVHSQTFAARPGELLWVPAEVGGDTVVANITVARGWRLVPIGAPMAADTRVPTHYWGMSPGQEARLRDQQRKRIEAEAQAAVREKVEQLLRRGGGR